MWQHLKQRIAENQAAVRLGALTTALVGLALLETPLGNGLVHYSYDLPAMLGPRYVPADLVIIKLDEPSLTELKQSYQDFDRRLHARLVRRLKADGARLVVFDIYFPESNPQPADAELAEAIAAHGNVVLAAEYSPIAGFTGAKVGPPLEAFRNAARGWGLSLVTFDTEPTVRQHFAGTEDYRSLPWVAAEVAGAAVTREPESYSIDRWLKYYGEDGTLPSLSYYLALQQDPGYFTNKYVFIGGKPRTRFLHEESDEFHTPFTHLGGPFMSGVEVNATTFLNLVRGEWLRRMPAGGQFLWVLLGGLAVGLGSALLRPLPGLAVGAGLMLLTGGVACLLFWQAHFWFSWLLTAGAQIPCAWICSLLAHTQKLARETRALEQQLALGGRTVLSPVLADTPSRAGSAAATLPSAVPPTSADGGGNPREVTSIADHTLIRRIGRGAYGEVFLARNAIGMYHAVKVIHRADFNEVAPYEREFRGIQKYMPISMNHPGLVHLLHVGRSDERGYFYYVMELGDDAVTGTKIEPHTYTAKNLSGELRQRGSLPVAECVEVFLALSEALHYLHTEQLVHRDIKPSNIIFVKGVAKFADIGLVTGIAKQGQDVTYIGTEGYIAPEGPGTAAADVYSLGIVLYETATGLDRRQFPELPDTLTQRPDHVDLLRLNPVFLKAGERDLDRRYGSAADMREDLRRIRQRMFSAT